MHELDSIYTVIYMKKILRNIKSTLKLIGNWILYLISFLIPKDKNTWIFIGWRKSKDREIFAENPKYVFLYTVQNKREINAVWIGSDNAICNILKEKGYRAYSSTSLRGIFYSLRARYTFLGGLMQPINWRWSGGTKIIQLWHSKSLKKTGYNSPYGLTRYNKFINPGLFVKYFKFVAMSKYLADFAAQDFHLKKEQILITGLPKHDVLRSEVIGSDIDCDTIMLDTINKIRSKKPNKILLYGPTFRPDGSNPLNSIRLDALNFFLKEKNLAMVITLHPKFSTKDWIPNEEWSNIYFSQNDRDTYPLLENFDLLITDYSSLSMDFLYMDKPVVLFAPDLTTFKKGMGVYDELWNIMPGPKAFTFDELLNILYDATNQPSESRKKAREILFAFSDNNASMRIVEELAPTTSVK